MERAEKLTKKFWIIVLLISVIIVSLLITGIVVHLNRKPTIITKTENGGEVKLNYTTNSNKYILTDIVPTKDDEGKKLTGDEKVYNFSVSSKLKKSNSITYEISIDKITEKSNLNDSDIKVYLEKEDSGTYNSILKPTKYSPIKKKTEVGTRDGMVITKQTVSKNTTDNYRLRIWLSETSKSISGNYAVEVNINAIAK